MKKIIFLMLCPFILFGQKHDNIWLFGYNIYFPFNPPSGTIFDFSTGEPELKYIHFPFNLGLSSASISDENGHLLFYTNGCTIMNADYEIMQNGEGLNPGIIADRRCPIEYPASAQSSLILPQPNNDSLYYLFHKQINQEYGLYLDSNSLSIKLLYTIINRNLDGGKGGVITKNQELWVETQNFGELTAVKHANGKDWWIISMKFFSNKYLFFRLTEQGVVYSHSQIIGNKTSKLGSSGAQTNFSPDGKRFARYHEYDGVFIFDFNRATGRLSNFQHFQVRDLYGLPYGYGGAIFSPNSRLLYIPAGKLLFQFDLLAEDVAASQIIIDTLLVRRSDDFLHGQLAPDCKIYTSSGKSTRYLHIINNPNELGIACNFEERALELPTGRLSGFPHFPNFRLGPLVEGEEPLPPCETIVDTEEILLASDNNMISLFPNPASDILNVQFHSDDTKTLILQIMDSFGRTLQEQNINNDKLLTIPTTDMAQGVYFCQIKKGKEAIVTKRFVIIR